MKKVSVREISRQTGYSPATVSNALNHKRGVSEETARAIISMAQELGYERPEKLSRIQFVLGRKTGRVLDEGTFHPGVIDGVERQAKRYGLTTTFTTLELGDKKTAERQVDEICADLSSAIVLLGTEMEEEDYRLFDDAQAPLVVVDGWSDEHFFESIVTSNENSAYRAVKYLVDKGHREIGYIAGNFRIRNFPLRERGYNHVLAATGIKVNPAYRVEVGTTIMSAYESMSAWLDTNPKLPTAFFADNDILALGAERALADHGIHVPDDVSLVGFDDLNYATIANPPLSTVHVPNHEMGELAVRRLVEDIRSPKDYTCITHMSTTFVERESVRRI